jgi:hypothetical protein
MSTPCNTCGGDLYICQKCATIRCSVCRPGEWRPEISLKPNAGMVCQACVVEWRLERLAHVDTMTREQLRAMATTMRVPYTDRRSLLPSLSDQLKCAQRELLWELEYYFDENDVEIGHVVFRGTPHESITVYDEGRRWDPAFLEGHEVTRLK